MMGTAGGAGGGAAALVAVPGTAWPTSDAGALGPLASCRHPPPERLGRQSHLQSDYRPHGPRATAWHTAKTNPASLVS